MWIKSQPISTSCILACAMMPRFPYSPLYFAETRFRYPLRFWRRHGVARIKGFTINGLTRVRHAIIFLALHGFRALFDFFFFLSSTFMWTLYYSTVTLRQWLFEKKAVTCKPHKSRPRKGEPPTRQTGLFSPVHGGKWLCQAGKAASRFPACWREAQGGSLGSGRLPAHWCADSTHHMWDIIMQGKPLELWRGFRGFRWCP